MIKFAIIGTGGMARFHVEKLRLIEGVEVVAACDIDRSRVEAFGKAHGIAATYTDFAELLRRCPCDAVCIVSPDATHAPLSLQAIAAGRHVLCEKPLATHAADAWEMARAAKAKGVINMVNFSYRNSSAWQHMVALARGGELGKILHLEAHYRQSWLTTIEWGDWKTSPAWLWRLSSAHGSKGALGDIGVHLLDFVTLPAGPVERIFCRLHTYPKAPGNRIGEYNLDANDCAWTLLQFRCGAMGSAVVTRVATGHRNSVALTLHGERGALRVDLDRSYDKLERLMVADNGLPGPWESVDCEPTPNNWQRFVASIRSGHNDQADFARGAEIQQLLDACERADASATWADIEAAELS